VWPRSRSPAQPDHFPAAGARPNNAKCESPPPSPFGHQNQGPPWPARVVLIDFVPDSPPRSQSAPPNRPGNPFDVGWPPEAGYFSAATCPDLVPPRRDKFFLFPPNKANAQCSASRPRFPVRGRHRQHALHVPPSTGPTREISPETSLQVGHAPPARSPPAHPWPGDAHFPA